MTSRILATRIWIGKVWHEVEGSTTAAISICCATGSTRRKHEPAASAKAVDGSGQCSTQDSHSIQDLQLAACTQRDHHAVSRQIQLLELG
jgi:hypothetical protein